MSAPFTLERVAPPDIEPVTLDEMIQQTREFATLAQTAQDQLSGLIVAAREWVEDYTGAALIDQTWRLTLRSRFHRYIGGDAVSGYGPVGVGFGWFGAREWLHWLRIGEILLRKAPILAITAFVSVDAAGAESDIDASTYELREKDSKWPRLVPLSGASWPSSDIRITFRAGFADRLGSPQQGAERVPEEFKQAIRLYAEALYDRDPKMMPLLLDTAKRLVELKRSELPLA
jgi:hypothetical protein